MLNMGCVWLLCTDKWLLPERSATHTHTNIIRRIARVQSRRVSAAKWWWHNFQPKHTGMGRQMTYFHLPSTSTASSFLLGTCFRSLCRFIFSSSSKSLAFIKRRARVAQQSECCRLEWCVFDFVQWHQFFPRYLLLLLLFALSAVCLCLLPCVSRLCRVSAWLLSTFRIDAARSCAMKNVFDYIFHLPHIPHAESLHGVLYTHTLLVLLSFRCGTSIPLSRIHLTNTYMQVLFCRNNKV